jgi:hypothetical protein
MKREHFLIFSALFFCSWVAQANLIGPTLVHPSNESDSTIIAAVSSTLGLNSSDVLDLLRLDNLASPGSGSPFTVTYGATGQATVSWNLNGTGDELYGVYVFGGNCANLYTVSSDELISSGSGQFITTPLNHGGQTPRISHILFLGTDAPDVPSTSNSITLLGMAMMGLAGLRAKVQKR